MNLVEILGMFSRKEFALMLRCLLDRIPVIVGGNEQEFVDDFLTKICDSISIRKEIVFGTDFINNNELNLMIDEEMLDYDNTRFLIRAPVNTDEMLLERIKQVKGWVIGMTYNGDIDMFFEKASRIREMADKCLFIKLDPSNQVEFMRLYKPDKTEFELDLEKRIVESTFSQSESSLERMNRVLDKKIKKSAVNDSILESLVDLTQEEVIIKENLYKKELQEFYNASRRGLALLSRLNFLNQFQPVKISKRTFFDAISYQPVKISRFLKFIEAEWNERFDGLLDSRLLTVLGDHLDSLWG